MCTLTVLRYTVIWPHWVWGDGSFMRGKKMPCSPSSTYGRYRSLPIFCYNYTRCTMLNGHQDAFMLTSKTRYIYSMHMVFPTCSIGARSFSRYPINHSTIILRFEISLLFFKFIQLPTAVWCLVMYRKDDFTSIAKLKTLHLPSLQLSHWFRQCTHGVFCNRCILLFELHPSCRPSTFRPCA